MLTPMIAAVVQMTSGSELVRNLARASELIAHAAGMGAELVALPENFALMRESGADAPNPHAQDVPDGEVVRFLREQAAAHRIVLAGGTFPERIAGDARVFNTSVVVDRAGSSRSLSQDPSLRRRPARRRAAQIRERRARERDRRRELPTARSGSRSADVRFPELYRALVDRGATVLLVPPRSGAGRDHWEVLLRARSRASASSSPPRGGANTARRVARIVAR
jgi:nitrilase